MQLRSNRISTGLKLKPVSGNLQPAIALAKAMVTKLNTVQAVTVFGFDKDIIAALQLPKNLQDELILVSPHYFTATKRVGCVKHLAVGEFSF